MNEKSYEQRLAEWSNARYAPPPEKDLTPSQPTRLEMISMRDGVRLYTEIFLPEGDGPFPVVLTRSPYPASRPSRNDKRPISRYLDAGYVFAFQMTRGQYRSEGTFQWHQADREDGHDCIEWLAEQSWCNGNVGMEGASYLGKVQIQAAQAKPPALKCIMPTAHVGHFTTFFPFNGGVPVKGWWLQLHQVLDAESMAELDVSYGDMNILKHPKWGPALRKRPLLAAADEILNGNKLDSWRETMSHPMDDEFWKPSHSTNEELLALDLPMFFTDGWYDITIGPIDFFTRLEVLRPDLKDRYLLVGPWNHSQTDDARLHGQDNGARKMPANSGVDLMALRIAFFDRYLKGKLEPEIQDDRVKVFITGLNAWFSYPTFPVPGTQFQKLYMHSNGRAQAVLSDGSLTWEPPQTESVDTYIYDPSLPTPMPPPALVEATADYRDLEIRSDVLTYTSAVFESSLTILGDIKLKLFAASDCIDTDWFAMLTEVLPDGRSIPFHSHVGALRARYHQGFDR